MKREAKFYRRCLYLALVLAAVGLQDIIAVVGRPATPVSVAGVARRTTRRAVVYTSSAAASQAAAQQSQAAAQQTAATEQTAQAAEDAAAAAASGVPAVGTVVTALPGDCPTTTLNGVQYYNCGGVYYRAAFQGNNLVYVVQQP